MNKKEDKVFGIFLQRRSIDDAKQKTKYIKIKITKSNPGEHEQGVFSKGLANVWSKQINLKIFLASIAVFSSQLCYSKEDTHCPQDVLFALSIQNPELRNADRLLLAFQVRRLCREIESSIDNANKDLQMIEQQSGCILDVIVNRDYESINRLIPNAINANLRIRDNFRKILTNVGHFYSIATCAVRATQFTDQNFVRQFASAMCISADFIISSTNSVAIRGNTGSSEVADFINSLNLRRNLISGNW